MAHLLNDLQVSIDLFGIGQAYHISPHLDLLIQIVSLVVDRHLFGGNAIVIYALVIQAIEVTGHVLETLLAFLRLRGSCRGLNTFQIGGRRLAILLIIQLIFGV